MVNTPAGSVVADDGTSLSASGGTPYLGKLPFSLKAGWGVGAFGSLGLLWIANVFVMYFLVNHVGIDPAVAGTILFMTRIWDLISDPLIGHLSDNSSSRWGRRRPWMFVGAIVSGISTICAFNVPAFESETLTTGYELVVLLIYFTGFTLFYVPFMAMPAEMTDDYDERTSIMSFRVAYSSVGGIVLGAGMPAMISQLGSDRGAYELTSIVAAILITASMLMTVAFTRDARELPRVTRECHSAREYLKTLLQNRPFFTLALLKFLVFLSAGINGAAAMFFMTHIVQRAEMGMAFLSFASQLASLLTVPLWRRLSVGKDKRWFWMFAILVNAGVNISWAFATPGESDVVFGIRAVVGGAMSSLGVMMSFSMLPDTIEYDRLTSRYDRAGMFTGLLGFLEKNSFALGPLAIGFFFSASGVVQGETQSDTAIAAIIAAKSWIPAGILLLAAALLFLYRLDAKRLEELRAEAAAAGGEAAAQAH